MCVLVRRGGESQYGQGNLSLSEAPTRTGTRTPNSAGKRPRQLATRPGVRKPARVDEGGKGRASIYAMTTHTAGVSIIDANSC